MINSNRRGRITYTVWEIIIAIITSNLGRINKSVGYLSQTLLPSMTTS